MHTADPYTIAQQGAVDWHIPDAHDRPLCGAVLEGQPVRRYLPCGLKPEDVCCERCRALKGQGQAWQSKQLSTLRICQNGR